MRGLKYTFQKMAFVFFEQETRPSPTELGTLNIIIKNFAKVETLYFHTEQSTK